MVGGVAMADEFRTEMNKMGPPWMRGPNGKIWWGEAGGALDTQASRLKECVKARFADYAPVDGLPSLARDRHLARGPGESEASFRARIAGAWEAWEGGGTYSGILLQLKIAGLPMGTNGAHIVIHGGRWYRINSVTDAIETGDTMDCISRKDLTGVVPTPPLKGFTLDGRDQFYSRFAIILPVDYAPLQVGSEVAAQLNRIVGKWKPGKAVYDGAHVIVSGVLLGWPISKPLLGGGGPPLGSVNVRVIPYYE